MRSLFMYLNPIRRGSLWYLVLVITGHALAEEIPFVQTRTLSAGLANQAILAAYSECSKRGFHVATALMSRDGRLQAVNR